MLFCLIGLIITTVSDFVDNNREIVYTLVQNFGSENVIVENRVILYPYETQNNIPKSYEVTYKARIERMCNYHFETISLANKKYIIYKMRHYIVNKKTLKTSA